MPGAFRLSDPTSGHTCPPGGPCGYALSTNATSGSPDTFINSSSAVRASDSITHICYECDVNCTQPCSPHTGTCSGSHSVFVNSSSIQAAGDPMSCGDSAASGSPDVIIE